MTHTNTAFANESFTYDANGNQTGTGYTTAAGNEQTASPGYTYTYDANGNMITSTQTSTGDVWTYGYDFRNQLTSAVEKSSSGTVLAQATYTYDALGNRIGMDENGVQTWTLYDGSSPIMDFSGSGSLETRYLNGPAGQLVDAVLMRESAAGSVAWYLPDRLGTVRDLINNAGTIIDHVDFSAFGTVLAETAPTVGDRFMGFAGLVRDSVTGLNLAVMRAQNPGTGRWTSQDPIGFAGGDANLYGYVGNGATDGADPSGLMGLAQVNPNNSVIIPGLRYPGVKPTLPDFQQILGTPCAQKQMTESYEQFKDWKNMKDKNGNRLRSKPESGRLVLWNPTTGQIMITSLGVTYDNQYVVHYNNPNLPGWVPIGTIHTHYGTNQDGLSPSIPDLFRNPGQTLYYGATFKMKYYESYEQGLMDQFNNVLSPSKCNRPARRKKPVLGPFPNPPGPFGPILA